MSKILVHIDSGKQAEFVKAVQLIMSESNRLVSVYHAFQPYNRIKTIDDFIKLVSDPLGEYDEALQCNVSFQESGGRKGDPEIIARLFNLERDDYQSIIKGFMIDPAGCKSCSKTPKIIKNGTPVINLSQYQKYQQYLSWNGSEFVINETLVESEAEKFHVYATTPEAIACHEFWNNACTTLNQLAERGLLGNVYETSKLLKGRITFSYQTNKLSVDALSLAQEISNLKN
jgi:hypothetical protein